jgi:GNAT superfamily N-acetyltransferase
MAAMKPEYQLEERTPTVAEFFELRKSVGWEFGDPDGYEKGLAGSLYAVCAVLDGEVVGTARVVGDGSICFYVQDVIVRPEHQQLGIGGALMERVMAYIAEKACTGAVVGMMVATGREPFYERFGFWVRPNDEFGPGMMQFWREPE